MTATAHQSPPTTIKDLRRRILGAGYLIDDATGGHPRVLRPNGTYLMPLPATPSDPSLKSTWRMFVKKRLEPARNTTTPDPAEQEDPMATRMNEVGDVIAEIRTVPGWEVRDTADGFKILPPDGKPPIHIRARNSNTRTLPQTIQAIRKAGLPDFRRAEHELRRRDAAAPAAEVVAAATADPEPQAEATVVERAAADDLRGVEEILLSTGEVVYGCTFPQCQDLQLPSVADIVVHRVSAHPEDVDDTETSTGPAVVARQPLLSYTVDKLREAIRAGEFGAAGARITPQKVLAEQWGVSSFTVGAAVRVLAEEGLLTVRRGMGGTRLTEKATQLAGQTPEPIQAGPAQSETPAPAEPAPVPVEVTPVVPAVVPVTDKLARAIELIQQAQQESGAAARVAELEETVANLRGMLTDAQGLVVELEAKLDAAIRRAERAEQETEAVRNRIRTVLGEVA